MPANFFESTPQPSGPYPDDSINLVYQMLFADNAELYRNHATQPLGYPFDILLSNSPSNADLQRIVDDNAVETRAKLLAYNWLLTNGHRPEKKQLLAVIVEVGLDGGLDTLAAYSDGTARYINYTGSMVVWESPNETSNQLIADLFSKSVAIVSQIGPWDDARRPHPAKGTLRLSFLVSDGLYFGEGPVNVLFNDAMAQPALTSATALMQYLTQTAAAKGKDS